MINDFLTIAVPVYNVGKYLKRCLESIITQIIKIDRKCSVLLINDGSEDNSGEICDVYAHKYSFIRVIHQKNMGLAEVRNICIKNSNSQYISFIDSDDYVLDGLYQHAIELLESFEADILCFKHIDIYNNENINLKEFGASTFANNDREQITVLSAKDALSEIFFNTHINVITCNKIIKTSLLKDIKFPVGKLYEDMFTTYKYISKANKILCINTPYYVYCHRQGSIGQTSFNKNSMDLYFAAKEVYEFSCNFCGVNENLNVGFLFWQIVVANMMIKADVEDNQYISKVRSFCKKHIWEVLKNKHLNVIRKIELMLFGVNLPVYKFAYKHYLDRYR